MKILINRFHNSCRKAYAFKQSLVLFAVFFTASINFASASNTSVNDTGVPDNMIQNNCLIIIGASYAKAWHIKQLLGCQVLNKGVDGNQSFEMLDRFNRDVLVNKPNYVLIWGFINDIFRSDPAQRAQSVERVKLSYRQMIDLCREHNIEPILATEVTIRGKAGLLNSVMSIVGGALGKTSYQQVINSYVSSTNDWLRQLSRDEGLKLLDFEKVLANSKGERKSEFAEDDGSHIPQPAYDALSEYTQQYLSQ